MLSNVSSENVAPEQSQISGGEPTIAENGNVAPPTREQIRTELDAPSSMSVNSGPGDSPPLPPSHLVLLNDGIADQQSRREYRRPILVAALLVLSVFTLALAGVVFTLGHGFHDALKPENIAKFVAVELREKIDKVSKGKEEKDASSSKDEALQKAADKETKSSAPKATDKESKSSAPKATDERSAPKEREPVKVDAKIYGEIRDSMVPLVALVSILAVAIVVILGTMLKAAFAPHPNNSTGLKDKEESSPVPILEAIKGLVDSIKAAWK